MSRGGNAKVEIEWGCVDAVEHVICAIHKVYVWYPHISRGPVTRRWIHELSEDLKGVVRPEPALWLPTDHHPCYLIWNTESTFHRTTAE